MTFKDIIRKLTSRKLWLAIAGVVTGVAMVLGAETSDIQTVAGAVTSLVSAITYIIVEGRVDAAGVQGTVFAIENALDVMDDE